MDMDRLIIIETINEKNKNIFNFNKDIFILYDRRTLSLYKRVNDSKIYELLSKIELLGIIGVIKINDIKLMIYSLIGLFEINIKNCKIKEISTYFYKGKYVEFIVNIKNNFYIYQKDILYILKYSKDDLKLISCYKYDKKEVIKNLLNIINPAVTFNIIVQNKIKTIFLDYMTLEERMQYFELRKLLITEELEIERRLRMMKNYERRIKMNELDIRQILVFEEKKEKKKNNIDYKIRIDNGDKNIKKINYLNKNKHFKNFKKKYR